ncbi:MAG: DUF4365 domain-containing protein [Gammaproteobacteria bacterium]|nr:DUF4365 domain-containing protein [Gammaproteobacteria bacterium]
MQPDLPEESESQEIGQHAVIAFRGLHPVDWRVTQTDGDTDAGLDMQIQLVNQRRYKGIFNAQIKGSRQQREDGKNKKLNADGTFISVNVSLSTLNYYLRVGNPVMLVFVDLTVDPNPRKCKAYYLWLNEELDELRGDHHSLDHLHKANHIFRMPVTNSLDDTTNVVDYLMHEQDKRLRLNSLYTVISSHVEDPTTAIGQLGNKFSSTPIALASITAEVDSPWIDAPHGSIAKQLHVISNLLSSNNLDLSSDELDRISQRISEASDHELAEYYFQMARLLDLMGKYSEALPKYEIAHSKYPSIRKYHLGLLESRLLSQYGNKQEEQILLNQILEKTGPEYARLKAKLYALLGSYEKALEVLGSEDDNEVFVSRALVSFLKKDYESCARYCENELLRAGITKRQQLTLLEFKSRSYFIIGMGRSIDDNTDEIYPFSGVPGMIVEIMRKAWSGFKLA